MAKNFPTSLDDSTTIPVEASTTKLSVNHVINHTNVRDMIIALETKVGVDGSAVTTSFDYKLSEITTTDKSVGKAATQTITNKTLGTGTKISLGSDATGDIYYNGGSGTLTRLAIGTNGYVLKVTAGIPAWAAETTISNATSTTAGLVELATAAEITAGTATGGSGAGLAITPDQLALSTPVFNGSGLTNLSYANIANITTFKQLVLSAGNMANSYVTTASGGYSTTEPLFVITGATGAGLQISRFIKLNNGSLVLTHIATDTASNTNTSGQACVIGNYLYVLSSNGGSPALNRYDKANLANETTMTISGTALTVNTSLFSDGTNLYNMYTAGTARIYTISGTTATSSTTVNYTSSATQDAYWSDGTSLYGLNVSLSTVSPYKWAIAGGSRTAGTTIPGYNFISTGGTIQTINGGILKEVGNSSYINTFAGVAGTNAGINMVVPITTF